MKDTDIAKVVTEGYVDALEDAKKLIAAKVGAFDGETNVHSNMVCIGVMANVADYLDSAVNYLEVKAGIKEPEDPRIPGFLLSGDGDKEVETEANGHYL